MKSKTKKNKKRKYDNTSRVNRTIQELSNSRDGGQIALKGYSYQLLYSCYLIISNRNPDVSFRLEGIEDVDYIDKKENGTVTHIQLKYSDNKWDASKLSDVLKNFLEVYLLDTSRYFKLVYDFSIAKGNLSKIIGGGLDEKSRKYWSDIIIKIKNNNPNWNWSQYNFDNFMKHISYENITRKSLEEKIEQSLIGVYDIDTDNFLLFINSLKVICLEKMERRESITIKEIENCIQSIKFDISKGISNPAHSWICRLNYDVASGDGKGFYEGKKATIKDIINGLPVKRPIIESELAESIRNNIVTVIKSSSGQGKTTLALQVAYDLQKEYVPYQLTCCNDIHELGNIVRYFKMRIRLGEKVLILIDNLDNHVKNWNELVQLMQNELTCNYRVLITTRETDWYNYSGDVSNIQSLNIVKPVLSEREAEDIYMLFKSAHKLHADIVSWESAWSRIAGRKLLIEYVFLLTHGEMLSERISAQISEINKTELGGAKCEILRKVCFADVCGVKLSISNLYRNQTEKCGMDFGEILKSMESEFLVYVDEEEGYIEGLHPVRSMHIVNRLREFISLDSTAISVIGMTPSRPYSMLFSHLAEFPFKKDVFFRDVVKLIFNEKDLKNCYSAIQGLFWGNVMQYYNANEALFNDAAMHKGLEVMTMELCPFTVFDEFGVEVKTLDKLRQIQPQNKDIEYLCQLRKNFSEYDLHETYLYIFCTCLYDQMLEMDFVNSCGDIETYAIISEWIYTLDTKFNLSDKYPLKQVWDMKEQISIECISSLMYILCCGNRDVYDKFVSDNFDMITGYLKRKTKSHKIYVDKEKKAIHVEYVYNAIEMKSLNDESVNRLKYICKTLPIFDWYCSDVIKPTIDMLSVYNIPDDAHKEMPIRNLVIMFRQNMASLWCKTIMSNYEFGTVSEWLRYWFDRRKYICKLTECYCECIYRIMGGKPLGKLACEIDECVKEYMLQRISEKRYPKQERPFEGKIILPKGMDKIKDKYFQSIENFVNQFAGFINRNEENQRLAVVNLKMAYSNLKFMQQYFDDIITDSNVKSIHSDICINEEQNLEQLMMCCSYYLNHMPNKYFTKYNVKNWYESEQIKKRKEVETGLAGLAEVYTIHFPVKTYTTGILHYYPLIVEGLNVNVPEKVGLWLIGCISFVESSFDYLVVLLSERAGSVIKKAVQIPKQTLIEIKRCVELNNEDINISPAYPVEVTRQMLECFEEKYDIFIEDTEDISCVGDIAEGLWRYSKIRELLYVEEDYMYLSDELQHICNENDERLYKLGQKISSDDIEQLSMLCQKVYDGYVFKDEDYNEVIEEIYKNSCKAKFIES